MQPLGSKPSPDFVLLPAKYSCGMNGGSGGRPRPHRRKCLSHEFHTTQWCAQCCLSCSLSDASEKYRPVTQISLTRSTSRPPSLAWGTPCWEPPASHCELSGSTDPALPPFPCPTSSLLMGTEGWRRFPISRRLSKRSASSRRRSESHSRIASSMSSRTFFIWDTWRHCRETSG